MAARAARAFGRVPHHHVQVLAGTGDAGTDRADRAVADRRGLNIGTAEQLGQHERRPAVRVEGGEQKVDRRLRTGLGRRLPKAGRRGGREAGGQFPVARPYADLRGAHPPRYGEQPGADLRVAAEPAQRGDGPQVGLLNEIIRGGRIDEMGAEPPHVALRLPDERGERVAIPAPGGAGKGGQLVHDRRLRQPVTGPWPLS